MTLNFAYEINFSLVSIDSLTHTHTHIHIVFLKLTLISFVLNKFIELIFKY